MSKRALSVLTWVITVVWVANFVAGFAYPTATSASVNAVFIFVVGVLFRAATKKDPHDDTPVDKPEIKEEPKPKELGGEQQ